MAIVAPFAPLHHSKMGKKKWKQGGAAGN